MPTSFQLLIAVTSFRAQLLARDRDTAAVLKNTFVGILRRIDLEIAALTLKIEAAQAAGETVGVSWLYRVGRLRELGRQAEALMRQYSRVAAGEIASAQSDAVEAGRIAARALTIDSLGVNVPLTTLPTEALTDLVGSLRDGSPLAELLDELGPDARRAVSQALIEGLALGRNPRVVAREMREAFTGGLTRSLRIARTEMLRAFRTASIRSYQSNRDVVNGWIWISALDSRTCPACIMQHGTIHSLSESFSSHPNCRCSPSPSTQTYADLLGIESPERDMQLGVDWFAEQPIAAQEAILGPAAFKAFRSGKVELADFVGRTRSAKWGPGMHTRSLKEILGAREAVGFYRKAA